MLARFFARHKHIILYGTALALLLLLLKWLEWKFIVLDRAFELYSGAIALVFTGLGVWLALKLARPKWKTVVIEREVYRSAATIDEKAQARLGLSARELEVLRLMADGLSNQEIATATELSVGTVKNYVSVILLALDVDSRSHLMSLFN